MSDPQGYPLQQFLNLSNQAALSILSNGPLILINGVTISTGSGSPQGVVTAPPSSLYLQIDGSVGSFWWQKQSGTGNTGWAAIAGGGGGVSGTPNSPGPGSASLIVDNHRTDTYTADGSPAFPFKTIAAAIAKVIANGDNTTVQYVILVCPGTYAENIVLENASLGHITFSALAATSALGNVPVILTGAGGANIIQSSANNTSMSASFSGFNISPSGAQNIVGSGCSGLVFINCNFSGNVGLVSMTSVASFNLISCTGFIQNVTLAGNTVSLVSLNSQPDAGSPSTWTLTGTAFLQVDSGSLLSNNVTVNTGCTMRVEQALTSSSSTIDIKSGGTFLGIQANIGGTLTAESGSTVTVRDSRVGSFTGTIVSTGTTIGGNIQLTQPAPIVAAGQVGLGATTAASATAGAATLPANPLGFLIGNVAGTGVKIPYYNT